MPTETGKPKVSIVICALNEEVVLESTLEAIVAYFAANDRYDWQLVVVNDGSTDRTAEIANAFAADRDDTLVLHHPRNFGLGQAMKFGFANTSGDYVVTLDVDLSYSLEHVDRLLAELESTSAKIVLTSPYMEGGKLEAVPPLRAALSIGANRFLSMFAAGKLSTLTGMVRGYDGPFIREMHFSAQGMDAMPEIIYTAMILRADIRQIPATLDWSTQRERPARASSMRVASQIIGTLLSGFMFRPFVFFVLPGLVLALFATYTNTWMVIHFFEALDHLAQAGREVTPSAAVAFAYKSYPHTFIVGLAATMLAVQLLTLGLISMQQKRYFDELFRLVSAMGRQRR